MKQRILQWLLVFGVVLLFLQAKQPTGPAYKSSLSEYGFFEGPLSNLQPKAGVLPYELNSPLFSDYAYKKRFIVLPKGEKMSYHPTDVFAFPVGTVIIKHFYYPHDFRKPEKGRTLLETRLLIHEAKGWVALPYVWNDAQTDALLDVAGETKHIQWRDKNGKKQKLDYSIPNMNQCKGCHLKNDKIVPIGPSARQLNRTVHTPNVNVHQLEVWQAQGLLADLPDTKNIPQLAIWNDVNSGSVHDRARAYLDANCGHCHRKSGTANTSGLYLDAHEQDSTQWGVWKTPIAAGRGSGDLLYNIHPGKPNASILVYRMESEDPGAMMPELGRKMLHEEGIALIKQWIAQMD